ncbi:MAG TPA: TolC family protein [Solimonas sp.]|nr:TolC family protein [Solimonas sp.]
MRFHEWLPVGVALLLAGCASLPADRGLSDVRGMVKARGGPDLGEPVPESGAQVSSLLAQPLTADRAVAVALLRNPAIRREYARLGIAQADVLEASRLSNPTLSVSVLGSNVAGDKSRIDYGLVQNFTDALFLSTRGRLARADLERAKQAAGGRILELAAEVSKAYYQAVSAGQIAQMREVIAQASEASGELAKRFHDAGNVNELEWKREQAAGTKARLDADAAKAQAAVARSALNGLLGLHASEARWTLQGELPLPVIEESPVADLQAMALEQRLDLAAKRGELAQLGQVRDLARKLRWLGVIEVGVQGERDTDGSRLIGPTFSLQLPIFNQGQSSIARIDAQQEQSQAELDQLEAEVGNSVASAYASMLAARARADRHLRDLIPQREAIVARTQELQNFMLVGQFELLVAKQEEYDAYQSYLEALRDYWLARVDLARAVGAKLPSDVRIGSAAASALNLPDQAPAMNMGGHAGHSMEDMPGMKPGDAGMEGMDHGPMDHSGHAGPAAEPEMKGHEAHQHYGQGPTPEEGKTSPPQPVIQDDAHQLHD